MMLKIVQDSLKEVADPELAPQMAKYMKNVVNFRGIPTPKLIYIYSYLRRLIRIEGQQGMFELADQLVQQEYSEDKKFGLMLCQMIKFDKELVRRTESWFTNGHIREWATSDCYSGKILTKFNKDANNAKLMLDWSKHDNIWIRRCSCVGFIVTIRKRKVDRDLLYQICSNNLAHDERFNQLGVGWLLREMSQQDLEGVINFLRLNIKSFSAEGLSYATEKMEKNIQVELRNYRKQQNKLEQAE